MSAAVLLSVLAGSLLGSLHCVGMCGGLVAFSSGADGSASQRTKGAAAHALGRLVAYLILGLVAGAAGATLDLAGETLGLRRVAAIVAGVLMLAWGLGTLATLRGWSLPRVRLPSRLQAVLSRAHVKAAGWPPPLRGLVVGLCSALLPCGWLHAFTITAAGTGKPVHGALIMAAFWLGTLPALSAVGLLVARLAGPLRQRVPLIAALVIMIMGLASIHGRSGQLLLAAEEQASVPPCHAPP